MLHPLRHTLAIATLSCAVVAQTNLPPDTPSDAPTRFVVGLDIEAHMDHATMTDYQSGAITAVSMQTKACNPGSVLGIWEQVPDPDHPLICQMYCRLSNNRFEQISDWSDVKHSFGSTNSNACGGGCIDPSNGQRLGLNCSDTYGATTNAAQTRLGPPWEVNPFTGVWTLQGSLFDRGYPEVAFPANTDGVLSSIVTAQMTAVQNRIQIQQSKIGTPGATYFGMTYYIHNWEAEANRNNNMASRQITLTTTSATTSSSLTEFAGTVLQRYTGARLESAANVDGGGVTRDGRFYVAVHVTQLPDGWFHYEFAVHNRDNHGRSAQFNVPLCPLGRYRSAGFKDVDQNAGNEWTISRQGNDLVWDAPPGNAQPWNTIYNFWFDSDAGPQNGAVEIVQASPQFGANATLAVASNVPVLLTNAYLGAGCNASSPELWPNGRATVPNAGFQLRMTGLAAGASTALHLGSSNAAANVFGCGFYVDNFYVALPAIANGSGLVNFPISIPVGAGEGVYLYMQGFELQAGGPLLGLADASNGVLVRVGNTISGCP